MRWRVVTLTLGLVAAAFVLVGMAVLQETALLLVQQRERDEYARAELLAGQLSAPFSRYDADAIYALCSSQSDARVLLLSTEGVVLVDSGTALAGVRLALAQVREVADGAAKAHGFYRLAGPSQMPLNLLTWLRGEYAQGTQWVGYYVAPVLVGNNRSGMVLVSSSIQDVVAKLSAIQSAMLLYFIVGASTVALLSVWMSGLITRPINELTSVMLKTTRGDFSARASTRGRDEIAQLGRTFNMMSEKLENLDRARSEFISSASHELKTPLSGMKILVESLSESPDMEEDVRRDFLQDINREIDRLSAIVGDLLTLVQIDSYGMTVNAAEFSLMELINETVARLRPIAHNRTIALAVHMEEEVSVHTDKGKLQQILYNLIDNAIKYTPDGGRVSITQRRKGRAAIVEVADTGVGIPEDSLAHVFDRFYRVDKARSRQTGGTGLGLSIVRNLTTLLGGDIAVQSQVGEGTTFTLTLPIQREKVTYEP